MNLKSSVPGQPPAFWIGARDETTYKVAGKRRIYRREELSDPQLNSTAEKSPFSCFLYFYAGNGKENAKPLLFR